MGLISRVYFVCILMVLSAPKNIWAADKCEDLLQIGNQESNSNSPETLFVSLAAELFRNGKLTSSDLREVISEAQENRRLNPIRSPEVGSLELFAFEKFEELISQIQEINVVIDGINTVLDEASEIQSETNSTTKDADEIWRIIHSGSIREMRSLVRREIAQGTANSHGAYMTILLERMFSPEFFHDDEGGIIDSVEQIGIELGNLFGQESRIKDEANIFKVISAFKELGSQRHAYSIFSDEALSNFLVPILERPESVRYFKRLRQLIEKLDDFEIYETISNNPAWANHSKWIQRQKLKMHDEMTESE